MNPGTLLAVVIAAIALAGGGVWTGIEWEKGRVAIQDQHVKEAVTAGTNAAAAEIAKIKPIYKNIYNQVQHETKTETVYRDAGCNHTDNGLQLVNQALSPRPSASSSKLP